MAGVKRRPIRIEHLMPTHALLGSIADEHPDAPILLPEPIQRAMDLKPHLRHPPRPLPRLLPSNHPLRDTPARLAHRICTRTQQFIAAEAEQVEEGLRRLGAIASPINARTRDGSGGRALLGHSDDNEDNMLEMCMASSHWHSHTFVARAQPRKCSVSGTRGMAEV
ncbi:uncharacterized protein B0H18DRAFT_1121792 [Fomitopsis serialis]|uniref:uncharacterized protein n=1 Tax=Fomitopsis serialis TaxID=139415 RepID=UPI002008D3AE|nr:uncharacterized protein B0H18DRAFT_1121792 [Neoantrodia serialis]KAH9920700.1 hypothetical protein B0H18DRAFT_1121792 [Neoantrodia serialis]